MKVHISLVVLSFWAWSAYAGTIDLGSAGLFAVLAGSTVTNTGPSNIYGDLGVSAGSAVTGFPPGIVHAPATIYAADATAAQAQSDLTTAYTSAMDQPCGMNLTATGNLGGLTLTPGVYCFSSSAGLTGTLTLNNTGNPNALFIFQIGSSLTTAAGNAAVVFTNGQDGDVFWQVGSSATLETGTSFAGNILAADSITLDTGATITCGSALAQTGAVTLDDNTVSINGCAAGNGGGGAPEPGTATLLSIGLLLSLIVYGRQARKQALARRL